MDQLNRFTTRRGSALLIVLGMLSFMVISAVAFSAYMRFARLPSSFLRRQVASKLLVKAALARAIDEVDAAIGNNPHPGVGNNRYYYPRTRNQASGVQSLQLNRNHWKQRVYMGGSANNNQVPLVSQASTVSPLCLEALAYLPPSIVNEVRYYSRHSQAAEWHDLGYDSGRYSFCAVDVSDYFDINALHADFPRLSSPGSRVSLSYLFENEDHSSDSPVAGMCSAANWDDFMSNFLPNGGPSASNGANAGGSKLPLISLADFNLALHSLKPGIDSPFCTYIEQSKGNFYGFSESGADAERIRRLTFVTDSYSTPTNVTDVLDLSDETKQPFLISDLTAAPGSKPYYSIVNYTSQGEADTELNQYLCGLGKCQLFDYLDKDIIPLSLAIPTVERTPMICGIDIGARSGTTLTITPKGNLAAKAWKSTPPTDIKVRCEYEETYEMSGLPQKAQVNVLVVFPFRNKLPTDGNFEIGGRISYFLSDADNPVKMRTYNDGDSLHLAAAGGSPLSVGGTMPFNGAVYSYALTGSSLAPSTLDISSGEKGLVKMVTLTPADNIPGKITFLKAKYTHVVDFNGGRAAYEALVSAGKTPDPDPQNGGVPDLAVSEDLSISDQKCDFVPLNNLGSPMPEFAANLANTLANPAFTKKLKLNVAVWVWVKDTKTGKVVDLVPACVHDDRDLNGFNDNNIALQWGDRKLGAKYPLMRFGMMAGDAYAIDFSSVSCKDLKVAQAVNGNAAQLQSFPQTVYVGDPRFNHAPEHWYYDSASAQLSESDWVEKYSGCRTRDGDIIMQTSDAGYLQSFYELSNMLYLNDFFSSPTDNGKYGNPDDGRQIFQQGFGSARNCENMWYTYDPFVYPNGSEPGVDFEDTKFVSSTGGYRVSPYAATNILMAAFANTPAEWRFAADSDCSGGSVTVVSDNASDAKTFNRKYAWNEYTTGDAKMNWEDLSDFALEFYDRIRQNSGDDWRDAFDGLGWNVRKSHSGEDAFKYLINPIEVEDSVKNRIYNCDRKFLYGFWRECLAPQQQLFLVFVRAEPTMMGGGMAGAIPPSLGARAVALVWRDPAPTAETTTGVPAPHRTRVLFYRQFE